jgi:hypothetical protein
MRNHFRTWILLGTLSAVFIGLGGMLGMHLCGVAMLGTAINQSFTVPSALSGKNVLSKLDLKCV